MIPPFSPLFLVLLFVIFFFYLSFSFVFRFPFSFRSFVWNFPIDYKISDIHTSTLGDLLFFDWSRLFQSSPLRRISRISSYVHAIKILFHCPASITDRLVNISHRTVLTDIEGYCDILFFLIRYFFLFLSSIRFQLRPKLTPPPHSFSVRRVARYDKHKQVYYYMPIHHCHLHFR